MSIKTARTQERRVQHVRAVGRRDHDDRFGRLEAIHFAEDLVEGLLPFVGAAANASSAHTADRVHFIYKKEAIMDN